MPEQSHTLYDAGIRLNDAVLGNGDLEGDTEEDGDERFFFDYGEGDELERLIRQATATVTELSHGANGRILARNGEPFSYDRVGRRTQDDRFRYFWSWRNELKVVEVKQE